MVQALRTAGKKVTDADLKAEVANAAKTYGYVRGDGAPDVTAWMEAVTSDSKTTRHTYVSDTVWPSVALRKLIEDEVQVTQQDLTEGFESNYGPRAEVLAIVLSDQQLAKKVWKMVRDNPTEQFFAQLAEQYSVEPVSSSNRGKVPPIRKFGGQPAIEKEAFTLKPGQFSGIVSTGGRHVLLWCQGFTEPVVTDPADVRDELIRDLTEKKTTKAMAERFHDLIDSSEIDNFLSASKQVATVAHQTPTGQKETTNK